MNTCRWAFKENHSPQCQDVRIFMVTCLFECRTFEKYVILLPTSRIMMRTILSRGTAGRRRDLRSGPVAPPWQSNQQPPHSPVRGPAGTRHLLRQWVYSIHKKSFNITLFESGHNTVSQYSTINYYNWTNEECTQQRFEYSQNRFLFFSPPVSCSVIIASIPLPHSQASSPRPEIRFLSYPLPSFLDRPFAGSPLLTEWWNVTNWQKIPFLWYSVGTVALE